MSASSLRDFVKQAHMSKVAHRCRKDILAALSKNPMGFDSLANDIPNQPPHEVAKEIEDLINEGIVKQAPSGELFLEAEGPPDREKMAAWKRLRRRSHTLRKHPDGDLIKESASPIFSSDGDRLYHDIGGGVSFSLPEGAKAERYKRQVEKEHGFVGSTAPTSKDDPAAVRLGKAVSRRMDRKNPNRPRYRSLKDFVLRRPDPNYRPGAEVRSLKKQAAATATKTDPAKWEAAKREAKSKMGGKHSARAMQLATNIYKKKGGGYSGAKPSSKNNSLKKWSKQKWNWSGGDKPGPGGKGVYLPKKKAEGLKKTESGRKRLAAASRKKSEATRKGQQYSSHGLAKGTSLKAKK